MKFVMSERDEKLDQIREKCEPAKTEKKKKSNIRKHENVIFML